MGAPRVRSSSLRLPDSKTKPHHLPRFEDSGRLLLLLLLPVAVLLFAGMLGWKRNVMRRLGDEPLVRSLIRGFSTKRERIRFVLYASALLLTVLGLANLQTPLSGDMDRKEGVDILFALDVSRSMHADDVRPTRLQVARQLLIKTVNRLPDARIGLVVFAGRAYLQMPMTFDHASAAAYVSAASPESVPSQGTSISEALILSVSALSSDEKVQKLLLMVTDGEDHEEGVMEAAAALRESGIRLMVVGMGTEAGVPLKNPGTGLVRLDEEGRSVVTRLNEPFLRRMAEEAGGLYLGTSEIDPVVRRLLAEVDAMEKTPLTRPFEGGTAHHFQWFLGAALALLLFDSLWMSTQRHTA